MDNERRHFPRFQSRREVEVSFPAWTVFKVVYTMNISKGGMRLELAQEPRVGETLTIKLAPPRGEPIRLMGVVRNVTAADGGSWSVGVEFTGLDAARRAEIEKLLAAHASGV